ncbi:hypothetical protein AB0N38_33085 [Micromonospora aurantiaca]|uniref:hypothetical protein n=1 Tax=Micromonospora aurantiaca (nom. illeg.) TaxID=47850 RepID=UPI00344A3DC5
MAEEQVVALPMRQFRYLLSGLTDQSRFRQWAGQDARRIDDPKAAAELLRSV